MVNLLLRVDALTSKAIFCNSLLLVEPGFFLFSLSHTITENLEEITLACTIRLIPVLFRFHFQSFVARLLWLTRSSSTM